MSADAAPRAASARGRVGPVSAVVVNYQGEAYLEACLRSIQALEDPVDEIVVVENASTDGSLNVLNTHFRGVELVRMKENVGAAIARNVGLRAAKHRFVLLVDNDVVLAPDTLTKLRAALEADPGRAMAQPRSVYKSDPSRVHYDGGAFHYAGLIALRNFGAARAGAGEAGAVDVDVVISLALLCDKKAVIDVGGFDEEMFILFEDLDLSYRLRAAGHRLALVEDAVVLHDSGTPGVSFRGGSYPERRVFLHSRNRWIHLAKNYRLWTLLVAAPGLLVYELAWLAFAARQGSLGAWWRGKRAFVAHRRRLWQKRRKAQRLRVVGDRRLLVGGPLTLSPGIEGGQGLGAKALDGALRAWWALARWLVV